MSTLEQAYAEHFPAQFARHLVSGEPAEIAALLDELPVSVGARIAARLPTTTLNELLEAADWDAARLLSDAGLDAATALLNRLPRSQALGQINKVSNTKRQRRLLQFLNYPQHSVGAAVTQASMTLTAGDSMVEARTAIAELGGEADPAIIVTTEDGGYLGVLDAWQLLRADVGNPRLEDVTTIVTPLRTESTLESAAMDSQWETRTWLPVVDHRGHVVGICRRAQLMQHASEQATPPGSVSSGFLDLGQKYAEVVGMLITTLLGNGRTR